MKYIIIGLGNYGHVLAEELSALGHEIIGADISESRVDSIKDKVATAFVIDATDEQSLSVLPLNSVDIVVVAIGENFGASVRVVALLKQKKVPRIFARAIDAVHKAVLEAFSLEKILTPEEDAARSLVQLLDFGATMEAFRIGQMRQEPCPHRHPFRKAQQAFCNFSVVPIQIFRFLKVRLY